MFEKILHSPLRLHGRATQAAQSLLQGLLERCVSRRLGWSRDLVSAVMHHVKHSKPQQV